MPRKTSQAKKECFVREFLDDFEKRHTSRNVCKELPVEHEYNGNDYCVLHFPNDEKHTETNFGKVLADRIDKQETDFRYVYFSDYLKLTNQVFETGVSFIHAFFNDGVDFDYTKFNGTAHFTSALFTKWASFRNTSFDGDTYFSSTLFENSVDFAESKFHQSVSFSDSIFNEWVTFRNATFEETSQIYFDSTVFKGEVDFQSSIFKGYITFQGKSNKLVFDDESVELDMSYAQLEKTERIYFRNVHLKPSWFINVNTRKFIFTDVKWENINGSRKGINSELESLKHRKEVLLKSISDDSLISSPHLLLTIACRQLADNYEENKEFEEASMFRQMALESKRLERDWWQQPFTLRWWYWLSSHYGESWKRALTILGGVLLLFSFIYMLTDFQVCPMDKPITLSIQQNLCEVRTLNIWEGIRHSLATATFQNMEYRKPITGWGETWIILERIIAPLQAALLALAIRRKFMR